MADAPFGKEIFCILIVLRKPRKAYYEQRRLTSEYMVLNKYDEIMEEETSSSESHQEAIIKTLLNVLT
jgi:5-formaminoimidazole-4-carboxamide-1-beta-D-ribofuranosyl 5'-monophosphate synthetase